MRLDCEVVQDLLPAYLDEKTCDVTNRLVGEHMAGCERCQAELGRLRAAAQLPQGKLNYPRMLRQRNWLILVLGVALVVCMAVACLLGFAQGGGYQRIDALRARDFFTGALLELPFSYDKGLKEGDEATLFLSWESAEALAERVHRLPGGEVTTQVVGEDAVLLTCPRGEEPPSVYLLCRQEGQGAWRFTGMGARFEKRTAEGISERSFEIVFPYHLITDERVDGGRTACQLEENYRTDYQAADFLAFYRSLGRYQIAETEEGFVIQGYSGGPAGYTVADFPVSFQFGVLGGQRYVSVHYS